MRPCTPARLVALAILAGLLLASAGLAVAVEEYDPLGSARTYNKPGDAPENQARISELDCQVQELRATLDKMAKRHGRPQRRWWRLLVAASRGWHRRIG